MRHFSHFLFATASIVLTACHNSSHDEARYEQIRIAIDGSENHMLDLSLEEATKLLSLEGVPWDEGYTNYPLGQMRIYHFRGFCLWLHLKVFPKGFSPHNKPVEFSFIESDLRRTGDWYVSTFYPVLYIDDLDDKDQRMTDYWRGLRDAMNERANSMKKHAQPGE